MNFEDKAPKITKIVVHESCPDGLASALILRQLYKFADVVFLQHNTKEFKEVKAEEGMIFCDISPPADRVQEFIDVGTYVLDHHKTAKDVVLKFGERGFFGDEVKNPGISGAALAAKFVDKYWQPCFGMAHDENLNFEKRILTEFARLAGIRDTWVRNSPGWDEACAQAAALMFWPRENWFKINLIDHFESWQCGKDSSYFAIGDVLMAKTFERVKKTIKDAYITNVKGYRVIMHEGTSMSSDVSDLLSQTGEVDITVGFGFKCENNVPSVIYSMRSNSGFDCSKFCKKFGGGGHTAAAGFSDKVQLQNPYTQFIDKLENYNENE